MNGRQSCPGCGEIIKYTKDISDKVSPGWIDLPKLLPRLVWKGDMPSHLPYIWVKDPSTTPSSKTNPPNVYKRNENWSQRSYTRLERLRIEKRFGGQEIADGFETEVQTLKNEVVEENDKDQHQRSSLKPLICKRCVDIKSQKSEEHGYINPIDWIDIFSKINQKSSLILIFDLSDLSFNENLKEFMFLLYKKANAPKDIVLIGTKMDFIPKYLQASFIEKMIILSKEHLPPFCTVKTYFGVGKGEYMGTKKIIDSIEGESSFLIGGCNVGKSSLWNSLTVDGIRATTSCLSGTTQKPVRGILKSIDRSKWIYDLPGIQSSSSSLITKEDSKTFLMKRCPRSLIKKASIGESILIGKYFRIDFDTTKLDSVIDKSLELMVKCFINKEISTLRKKTTDIEDDPSIRICNVVHKDAEIVLSGGIGWASLHFPPKSSNLKASIFSRNGNSIYPFMQAATTRLFHSRSTGRPNIQLMTKEEIDEAISRLEDMAPPPEPNDHRSAIQRLAQQQADLGNRRRGDPLELIDPSKKQQQPSSFSKNTKWKGRY